MTRQRPAYRFALEPVDLTFFHTAPSVSRQILELAASPDEVWAAITAKQPLSWCAMLTRVRFEGEPPYGEGAIRHAEVGKAMRMQERFFHWDDAGRRLAFHAVSANVPVFESFAEDYLVEKIPGGTRFTWTFASAPRQGFGLALKLGAPVSSRLYAALGSDTIARFGALTG